MDVKEPSTTAVPSGPPVTVSETSSIPSKPADEASDGNLEDAADGETQQKKRKRKGRSGAARRRAALAKISGVDINSLPLQGSDVTSLSEPLEQTSMSEPQAQTSMSESQAPASVSYNSPAPEVTAVIEKRSFLSAPINPNKTANIVVSKGRKPYRSRFSKVDPVVEKRLRDDKRAMKYVAVPYVPLKGRPIPSRSAGVNMVSNSPAVPVKTSPGETKNPMEKQNAPAWKFLDPVKVDGTTHLEGRVVSLIGVKDYWHKFIVVGGASLDKTLVLKTILNGVYPTEFVPVLYRIETPHSAFLARGCLSAIAKLFHCKFKLMLEGSTSWDKTIVLEVVLCFAHISSLGLSVHDSLTKCVFKRYNSETNTLDLSNFCNDPDLADSFYCPLWLPKVFSYVLLRAKTLSRTLSRMYLNNNDLTSLKVHSVWNGFLALEFLDLSNNKLKDIHSLMAFMNLNISELILDNNPLCAEYKLADEYIRSVRSRVPSLKKLDGVVLADRHMVRSLRNYVVSTDGVDLVDQFLERYFTFFDGDDRRCLRGFYHDEALFSMSSNLLPGQSTSNTSRLTRYNMESRNLFKMSDYSKTFQLISHGPQKVIPTLCRLPKTEHDPFSFSVDLVQFTADYVMLGVSGVFRERSLENPPIRFFSRSFVLCRLDNSEYQISNEILFVSNATTKQEKDSFKFPRPLPSLTKIAITPSEQLDDEGQQMLVERMADLTDMNPKWARKCLEESQWKFREALQVFTELLKMDKIPADAFVKQ